MRLNSNTENDYPKEKNSDILVIKSEEGKYN